MGEFDGKLIRDPWMKVGLISPRETAAGPHYLRILLRTVTMYRVA
jgi:hypothetical protein